MVSVRRGLLHMRYLAALAVVPLATVAFADTKYNHVAKQTSVKAVKDSTSKWVPPIQPTFRIGAPTPRNPRLESPPPYVANTLPVGNVVPGLTRGTVEKKFPGIGATGWYPPDPNIAVGPNHVVAVVNSDVAWFDKTTGTKQFQVGMEPIPGPAEGFFETLGPGNFIFDPKCFYDQIAQRFFVLALEEDDATQVSKVLIAVSDDADPNGTWFKYRFEAKLVVSGNPTWMDYPGFGWNKDAIVVTGNQFGFTTGWPGMQAIVIPKAPLLTGASAATFSFLIPNTRTTQVCHNFDANLAKIYMVGQGANSSSMNVFAVQNLTSTPTISQTSLTIPSWVFPFFYADSAGGQLLDTLDGRIYEADYRAGKIVCAHAPQVSNSDGRTMVRWYEINTNDYPTAAPTLSQSGNVIGGAGEFYHMPGIGTNAAGDIALIFTRSSTSIVADVMVAGRKATDAPGTMSSPGLVTNSLGSFYNGFRWGDYFSMEIDPADDLTFWGVGMIGSSNGNWATEITKLKISDIIGGGAATAYEPNSLAIYVDALSSPKTQGSNLVGGTTEILDSDNAYASLDSVNVAKLGQIAALVSTFQADLDRGAPKAITIKTETNVNFSVTGMVWLYDYKNNKYVQMKSFALKTGSDQVINSEASGKPFSNYISSTGEMKAVIRALAPVRTGRGGGQIPPSFKLKVDEFELRVRY